MKKFYLLLFSSIVLSSCQVEEPILPEEQKNTALNTVSIEMALSALSESSSKSMTKQGEDAYVVPRPEEFYYSDIGNSQEKLLIMPARHKNPGVYSRIFILEVNGVIQTRVFNMYPEQPQNSPYFSGEIGIFNLEGEFLNGFRVKNGQRISILTESKIVNKMVSDGVCQEHGNCYETSICIHCEQSLDEVIIDAPAPSEPENIDVPTLYPDYEPDGNEEPLIDYGGGPSDGGAGDNSTTTPTEEEDKIDPSELEGKAECIYNGLNVNSSVFKKIIQNFDGDFPVSHLKFSINNLLPSGNYGVTIAPENYWIEIQMSNTQLANISDLGSATAFVHEIIHAEIFRKMLSAAQAGDLDPENMSRQEQIDYVESLKNNFPGIYDYYIDRYNSTWNHNMMAEHYTTVIADAIQQFDNFSQSRQIYEDVAWAGLRKLENGTTSVAWNNLSDIEQARILKALSEHFFKGPSNCQ